MLLVDVEDDVEEVEVVVTARPLYVYKGLLVWVSNPKMIFTNNPEKLIRIFLVMKNPAKGGNNDN